MEWRSGYSGFNTSARPAIAAFGGQYHLFFRDDGDNDGIMHVISDNGEAWSRPRDFYINWNASSGPCPVATDERLHVFFRDTGSHDGLMHVAADDGFTFGAQDPFYLGQNVYAETRGAVLDDGTIFLISRPDADWSASTRPDLTLPMRARPGGVGGVDPVADQAQRRQHRAHHPAEHHVRHGERHHIQRRPEQEHVHHIGDEENDPRSDRAHTTSTDLSS
jgi:hypothetical protein